LSSLLTGFIAGAQLDHERLKRQRSPQRRPEAVMQRPAFEMLIEVVQRAKIADTIFVGPPILAGDLGEDLC
jgi:hypothetical protein